MRWYFVAAILLYCALIFWMSSRPVPEMVPRGIFGMDKVLHAGCFGVLALLVALGMRHSGRAYSARTLFWVPFLFATAYGATDELHQYFIPQRTHDVWDWVADATGALIVMLVLFRFGWGYPLKSAVFPPRQR